MKDKHHQPKFPYFGTRWSILVTTGKKFMQNLIEIPTPWGKSALKSFRFDLAAGISVALVALPLSLGIAIASGTPAISGLISAMVGGIFAGFLGGTQVGVKGPAAGLIVVTLAALDYFGVSEVGLAEAYPHVLGAFVVSGALMTLIGVLRLGKIADVIPAAVVKGMLAAIGLIILTKQLDIAFLGKKGPYSNSIDILSHLNYYIQNVNPVVAIITTNCLLLLAVLPRIKNKVIDIFPPPMWVMLVSVPFVFLFDFFDERSFELLGRTHSIGREFLVQIPADLLDGLVYPNFSRMNEPYFWMLVVSVTLVSTVENLASAKAIEGLDPFKRKTKMNKDMISSGLGTILASCIGGLPVITVIARSSVNINHGAKTLWANFWHGLLVFLLIFFFGAYVENVPLAALSAILLFTGYKLASPRVFQESYRQGSEQFLILVITIFATLSTDLVWGIVIGILATLTIHNLKSSMSVRTFFRYLLKPNIKVIEESGDIIVKIKGIANFFNILNIRKVIRKLPPERHVLIEFSGARLIDYTVLEYVHTQAKEYNRNGGKMELIGLDVHESSGAHPYAIRVHLPELKKRLTRRQQQLQAFAIKNGWNFQPRINWKTDALEGFHFFDTRPVEYEKNVIYGAYARLGISWKISDITFDEGALLATEVYHTTAQLIELPYEIPVFSMEKEYFTDRVMELAGFADIDFSDHNKFSKNFLLTGDDKEAIQLFFTKEIKDFFVNHEVYHVESNGHALLLFKYFRLGSLNNVVKMINFGKELAEIMRRNLD